MLAPPPDSAARPEKQNDSLPDSRPAVEARSAD